MKCPNAAHLWQLGWAKPVADLDLSALTVGRWRTVVLPTASESISNFLRLTGLAGGTYFVNYRQAKGQYEQVREGQYAHVCERQYKHVRDKQYELVHEGR